jgi:dipeptidyl aminopeptidase/acylaminoacyl peptidase
VSLYPETNGQCGSSLLPVWYAFDLPEILAEHGYVVQFISETRPEVQTQAGRLAALTDTVLSAVDEAVSRGYSDPDRIGLYGVSQGFFEVLKVASESPRFKASVAAFGISDMASHYDSILVQCRLKQLGQCAPGSSARYELADSPNYVDGKPWDRPDAYFGQSPVFHANRIESPVLLFGSEFDWFTPNQADEIFSALYRLRKEAKYVFYWGEMHPPTSAANLRDYSDHVVDWFDEYLVSPKPPK